MILHYTFVISFGIWFRLSKLFISLLYSIKFSRFTKLTKHCPIYHSFVTDQNQ